MGVDWLDITFRLEREFDIKLRQAFTAPFFQARQDGARRAITCGDVCEMVIAACNEQGRPVPFSAWRRVKVCIGKGCGAKLKTVVKSASLTEIGCI